MFKPFCCTSKSHLSSTTKCDQTHSIDCYKFGHTESSSWAIVFVQQTRLYLFGWFPKAGLRWVCWTFKSDLSSTTKCDKLISMAIINLVSPKAGAKHEPLFNKPASIEQKLTLSSSFRHDLIHNYHRYDFCHMLLCYLSQT